MSRYGTPERDGLKLRYVRHYPHPPEKVWRALVEPDELKHWFPAAIEGERKAGAKLRFVFEGDNSPATFGVMRVYEPPRVLELTWENEVLRFELTPEPGGSRLDFIASFSERVSAPRDAVGWHRCLDGLDELLGEAPQTEQPWLELYQTYGARLGPGDYPGFVKEAGKPVRDAMQTPGLDGWAFEGANGTRIELLRAGRDAETREHAAARHEYLVVLEGRYELSLGGGRFVLERGIEFAFPEEFPISGAIQAGTRLLRAVR